jgi:hypothetical protein
MLEMGQKRQGKQQEADEERAPNLVPRSRLAKHEYWMKGTSFGLLDTSLAKTKKRTLHTKAGLFH